MPSGKKLSSRVLFVTRKFPPSIGGMETYSKHLYEALREIGTEVRLVKPKNDHIGRPRLAQVLGFFVEASLVILRHRRQFDAILIGDYALAPLAIVVKLASAGRIRTVVSLHGNDLYFMRGKSLASRFYSAISRCVVATRCLDAAVANSGAIRDEAATRGLSQITVIPLGTVVEAIPEAWMNVRERRLLFAGRLIRYKGLSWFMRNVWPQLDDSIDLIVAGTVWDETELAAITGKPRVKYLGAVPYERMAQLRATSLACIMPNLPPGPTDQDEGFGLAALEGPAVGTPTIASRSGGLAAAVTDQITGFLLPPLDVAAWVACINSVAAWSDEDRAHFAEQARKHLRERCSWEHVARRTLATLQGIPEAPTAPSNTR